MDLHPYLFCLSFYLLYFFSYLFSKTIGYFSGCLMSSASVHKLFWGIYSVYKCSFDEFVGGKVVSPSSFSTILGPPCPWDFQVRILEWAAISFSRGSPLSQDQTQVSCRRGRFFTIWATREALEKNKYIKLPFNYKKKKKTQKKAIKLTII